MNKTHNWFKRLLDPLLSTVFPHICAGCGDVFPPSGHATIYCAACAWAEKLIGDNVCAQCGKPLASPETGKAWHDFKCGDCRARSRVPYRLMRSLLLYEDPTAQAIKSMKFRGKRKLAAHFGRQLGEFATEWGFYRQCCCVVAVPISWQRHLRRGYNQSGLLAEEVSKSLGIFLRSKLLIRKRHNRPQSLVEESERKRNVRGAFVCTQRLDGGSVLLVDDIVTSAATVEECSRVLKRAGADEVMILTLARARTA